jgi:ribosome-associated heat shock protein Hsp15
VKLNESRVKPAHDVRIGDAIVVREWHVHVKVLSDRRGPAEKAKNLYEETAEGRAERERRSDLRRWGTEPARSLKGRPTKRDRRLMESLPILESDPADDRET